MQDDNDYVEYEESNSYNDLYQVYEYCIAPSIEQTFKFMTELFISNIFFLILTRTVAREKEGRYHVLSTVIGLIHIYLNSYRYNIEALCIIPLVYISYLILTFQNVYKHNIISGFSVGAGFMSILMGCEFFYYDYEAWLKIRSVVMIAMMKIISLSFDYQKDKKFLSIWEYSGYIWCPANSILGPWMTYKHYAMGYRRKQKITFHWVLSLLKYFITALIFVCCSNCIIPYIISTDFNKFIGSYRDASSFRMSHYFVSYIASGAMVTAGFSSSKDNHDWSFAITNPLEIELPRSLVNVVINWNIPTHTFLKKYIFPGFLPWGKFVAVFMTYVVSSMLHGLSVEVSVVLLSLGVFSYVQYKFQDIVATLFNACVKVRPCKSCLHAFKRTSILAIILNVIFSIITILYLAYIGCLMDTVNDSISSVDILYSIMNKWSSLHFVGHIILSLCLFFTWSVKIIFYMLL